jgi:tRNA threonylcarbamoyladenosine biosynthesis protein TsaB
VSERPFNLAIETSTRAGSISLGRGDEFLATVPLHRPQRHNLDLIPAVDKLFRACGASSGQLREVYVCAGPGSFTGLRIGVAAAKMFAMVGGVKLVAVPAAQAIACNAPLEAEHVAVCLIPKAEQFHTSVYARRGTQLHLAAEPRRQSLTDLLRSARRPLTVITTDTASVPPDTGADGQVCLLPPSFADPSSENVWKLGRAAAAQGRFADPMELAPLYGRPPEAVEIWEQRKAGAR